MVITYEVGDGLYVNVTNRCTNSCSFCVRSVADGTYGSLWLEREPTVEEILSDIFAREPENYSELVFCGYGEPTVRFYDIIRIALSVKERYPQMKIRLNTNGHACLILGKDVTPLLRGAIDTVSVSLNTASAADYERVCAPCFAGAYEGLLEFAGRAKAYTNVMFSVVRGSIPDCDIERCQAIADEMQITLKVREMITDGENN